MIFIWWCMYTNKFILSNHWLSFLSEECWSVQLPKHCDKDKEMDSGIIEWYQYFSLEFQTKILSWYHYGKHNFQSNFIRLFMFTYALIRLEKTWIHFSLHSGRYLDKMSYFCYIIMVNTEQHKGALRNRSTTLSCLYYLTGS